MDGTRESSHTPLLDGEFLKTVERLTLAVGHPFPGRARPPHRSSRRTADSETSNTSPPRTRRKSLEVDAAKDADLPFASPATSARDLEIASLCHLFRDTLTGTPDLRLSILIDAGQCMASPCATPEETPKFLYARRLAGAVGYAALIRYGHVQVTCFAARAGKRTPTLRGREGAMALLKYLSAVRPGGDSFAHALEQFAARHAQPGVCLVISDFLDPQWEQGIRALLSRRFRVILLQVLSPSEFDARLGEDLRLVDADTGQMRAVSLGPVASARYQAALNQFFGMLGDAAGRHGMEYLRVTTSTGFEEALLSTLRRAGLPRRP